MFTLKHVVVLFILQNTVSSESCIYFEDGEHFNKCSEEATAYTDVPEIFSEHSENGLKDPLCPEGHSRISYSDIKYLIEEKAKILKIKENFLNNYYPESKEIFKKYMDEIEEFLKRIKDRPEHIRHILSEMATLRQKLEPDVEEIAAKIEEFHTLEINYKAVAENSLKVLTQLEKYKNICEISCKDYAIVTRFGLNSNPLIVSKLPGMYCVTLKDLNDNITKKLNEASERYEASSNDYIEIGLMRPVHEYKDKLKEAAVKQFGMTMYDILSLQDDYHHFAKELRHNNISVEIYDILENTAEIELRLIGMKRNMEKFRKYCMKCTNRRIKRNVFDPVEDSIYDDLEDYSIPTETTTTTTTITIDVETNIIDELINATINEITEIIKMNQTTMFEELHKIIDDPNVIELYLTQLHSMQYEIEDGIKMELEAFFILKNSISNVSIDEIRALSQESKQMIQTLESAKQSIDSFISRTSK